MRVEYTSKTNGHNVRGTELLDLKIINTTILKKNTNCGFFEKLFHGNDVVDVEQRLFLKLPAGKFIREGSKIVDIKEPQKNVILFITEDDSRYAIIFSEEDGRNCQWLYDSAVSINKRLVTTKIKEFECFQTLRKAVLF